MFIGTRTGIVSATIRAPLAAARVEASSCRGTRSTTEASTVRTFQFSGRPAAALIAISRSISSSAKRSRHPSTIASSCVPSCSPVAAHSASNSSLLAHLDATGCLSPSVCVRESVVENPTPPESRERCNSATMAAISSAVAARPIASSPIT